MMLYIILFSMVFIGPLFAQSSDPSLKVTVLPISAKHKSIGFDDLIYSAELHKVLVPAAQTGKLYLIDPLNLEMTSIDGFTTSSESSNARDVGVTSADEGEGFIFTADHGKHDLDAVDIKSGLIVSNVDLAGDPDYVRYIGYDHEVWVTMPHNKMIEVFKFSKDGDPMLKVIELLPVPYDPESLVIDHLRGRAYTNLGQYATAFDLRSHNMVSTWLNGCKKSRGDALDEQKGFLFVSCKEGEAMVFDLNHNNKKLGQIDTDPDPDVISYNAKLSHLYFTSSSNATLTVLGVSALGELSILANVPAAKKAHCVASDDQYNIWVCDPRKGQLLVYKDLL